MRRYLLLILISTLAINIFAQPLIEDLEIENDLIQVNYQKKSAKLAVAMSAVLPGAGSIFVNPKRWVGYIFPIIEGALIYSYISYRQDATDQERAYEKFVNGEDITVTDPNGNVIYEGPRYNRDFQNMVQAFVSDVNSADIYDVNGQNGYYRLDEKNTQHFYEDAGKYKKYIYGWVDWYEKYAYNGGEDPENPVSLMDGYTDPIINWSTSSDDFNHIILGYQITNDNYSEDSYNGLNTTMRAQYIQMRRDAQEKYDSASLFLYGMVLNRVVSAIDAGLAVKKYNKNYISQSDFQFNYAATTKNDRFTPMVFFTQRF